MIWLRERDWLLLTVNIDNVESLGVLLGGFLASAHVVRVESLRCRRVVFPPATVAMALAVLVSGIIAWVVLTVAVLLMSLLMAVATYLAYRVF